MVLRNRTKRSGIFNLMLNLMISSRYFTDYVCSALFQDNMNVEKCVSNCFLGAILSQILYPNNVMFNFSSFKAVSKILASLQTYKNDIFHLYTRRLRLQQLAFINCNGI